MGMTQRNKKGGLPKDAPDKHEFWKKFVMFVLRKHMESPFKGFIRDIDIPTISKYVTKRITINTEKIKDVFVLTGADFINFEDGLKKFKSYLGKPLNAYKAGEWGDPSLVHQQFAMFALVLRPPDDNSRNTIEQVCDAINELATNSSDDFVIDDSLRVIDVSLRGSIEKYIVDVNAWGEYRKLTQRVYDKSNNTTLLDTSRTVVVHVHGIGCVDKEKWIDYEKVTDHHDPTKNPWDQTPDNIYEFCDTASIRTFSTVVCSVLKPPKFQTPFVDVLKKRINSILSLGYKVLLTGYSYGGGVAAQLGETYRHEKNLSVATFGTIYIPKEASSSNKERHYIFRNDIVKCMPHMPGIQNHPDVVWLDDISSIKGTKSDIFGSSQGWVAHNNYHRYITAVHELKDNVLSHKLPGHDCDKAYVVRLSTNTNTNAKSLSVISAHKIETLYDLDYVALIVKQTVLPYNSLKNNDRFGIAFTKRSQAGNATVLPNMYVYNSGEARFDWTTIDDDTKPMLEQQLTACVPNIIALYQNGATCWFYACLNSLLSSAIGRALLQCKLAEFVQKNHNIRVNADPNRVLSTCERTPEGCNQVTGKESQQCRSDKEYLYWVVDRVLKTGIVPGLVDNEKVIRSTGNRPWPNFVIPGGNLVTPLETLARTLGISMQRVRYNNDINTTGITNLTDLLVVTNGDSERFKGDLPPVINVKGTEYKLNSAAIVIGFHAITGSMIQTCANDTPVPIIIDSNGLFVHDIDWSKASGVEQIAKVYATALGYNPVVRKEAEYVYALYINTSSKYLEPCTPRRGGGNSKYCVVDKRVVAGRLRNVYRSGRILYIKTKGTYIPLRNASSSKTRLIK